MLDLKLIREQPDAVREALARRGEGAAAALDAVIGLDHAAVSCCPSWRGCALSRTRPMPASARPRTTPPASGEIVAMRDVAARAKQLEQQLATIEAELQQELAPPPNLPDPGAAAGPEDELVRHVGAPP